MARSVTPETPPRANVPAPTWHAAGLNLSAVLGAQTAGGAIGDIRSPGNVVLGTTAGILGREGEVLRITFPLTLLISAVVGAAVLMVA